MGAQAWPFNYATTGDPAYTAQQLRQLSVAPFVAMGSSGRPLGAKSGIRVGTPSSVATITGSGPYSWNIGGFAGVIDGEANAAAGPYTYSFDTTQTGTIAAAGAAARVDAVDVVISDSDEGDGSAAKTVTCVYTEGPATGGAAPAAPARSHRLFLINVPTSGAPTIQWAPEWSGSPGHWTFNTYAELTAYTTLITAANIPVNQHVTVIADTTATNNGGYGWSGSLWLPVSGVCVPHFVLKKSSPYPFNGSYADHTWDSSLSEGSLAGFTTSDWVTFTCNLGGVYLLGLHLTAATGGTSANLAILKNAAIYREDNGPLSGAAWTSLSIPVSIRFAVGDTFKMQTGGSGGTGLSDATKNYCSVDYLHG